MRHKSEELMKQIMDYAEQFQLLNHRSPYTSEIADALGIVKSTVYKYLVAMNDRGMLSYRNGEIVTERTNKISLFTKPAAVLGSVSCGMPQLEEEYIEEYVSLPVSLFGEGEWRFYDRSRYQQWRYDCDSEAEYSFGWRHCCSTCR